VDKETTLMSLPISPPNSQPCEPPARAMTPLDSIREMIADLERRNDPAELQAVDEAIGDAVLDFEIRRKNNARYQAYLAETRRS
jgi:hypothetical protein